MATIIITISVPTELVPTITALLIEKGLGFQVGAAVEPPSENWRTGAAFALVPVDRGRATALTAPGKE